MKKFITPLFLAGLLFQGCAQSSEATLNQTTEIIQPSTNIPFELADYLKSNTKLDNEVERIFKLMVKAKKRLMNTSKLELLAAF